MDDMDREDAADEQALKDWEDAENLPCGKCSTCSLRKTCGAPDN